MVRRSRKVAALATGAMLLLLPACGGGDTDSSNETETDTVIAEPPGGGDASTSISESAETSSRASEPVPVEEGTLTGRALPQSEIPQNIVPTDPTATDSVVSFVRFVAQNVIDSWRPYFTTTRGMPEPDVQFVTISPGEVRHSACGETEAGTDVLPDYGSPFYCNVDQFADGRVGGIFIPITTMTKLWNGDVYGHGTSEWPGDFAVAQSIAHEFGHHVAASIAEYYKPQGTLPPAGVWNELIADCFSGNWTQAVYNQGILDNGDYQEALAKIGLIGDVITAYDVNGQPIFDPGPSPHGAPNHRQGAFEVGVAGDATHGPGDPQTCIDTYWRQDKYDYRMQLPV
jgi:predicted metalloprotease